MAGTVLVGSVLYRVSEGFRSLDVESVTVKKITPNGAWFNDRVSAFGYRSRMDLDEAERCATNEHDAIEAYVSRCRANVEYEQSKLNKALELSASKAKRRAAK